MAFFRRQCQIWGKRGESGCNTCNADKHLEIFWVQQPQEYAPLLTGRQGACIDRQGLGLEYEAWRVEDGTFCGIAKTDRCRADEHNCQEELSPFAIFSRDSVLSNDPCTWPAVINFLTAGQYPKQSREKKRNELAFHNTNNNDLSRFLSVISESENKSDMTPVIKTANSEIW